jgi:hypothetical protein
VAGVSVTDKDNKLLGSDNGDGFVVVRCLPSQLPARWQVGKIGRGSVRVDVDSAPSLVTAMLPGLPDSRFAVFPNVVHVSDPLAEVTVEFVHKGNARSESYIATLRGVDGTRVWMRSGSTTAGLTLRFAYDCRNAAGLRLLPGMYIMVIECGDSIQKKKLLVVG